VAIGLIAAFCGCSELITDDQFQSLTEITSLANSLPNTIRSRLELLNEAKECARKYEGAFDAASTALTAAKKQQTDAINQQQVISLPVLFGKLEIIQ